MCAGLDAHRVLLVDWDWSLYFGLATMRGEVAGLRFRDPYADNREISIVGKLLNPKKPKLNAAKVRIVVRGQALLNHDQRQKDEPIAIGSAKNEKSELKFDVYVPNDVMASIQLSLLAEKIQFIKLSGEKLRHNQAKIFRVSVHSARQEVELEPGVAD